MKNVIKMIAACAVLTGACAVFGQNSVPMEPRNVVHLSASGVVDVQQDWLTLTLAVTRDGTEAAALQSQLRQALDSALLEVKKTAQANLMEVRTGQFSLQPRYSRDGKVTGWVGTAELVLEGQDFGRIGAAAARAQTLTISNVAFSLSKEMRRKTETLAQEQALERFKQRAKELAEGFGFAAYGLRELSVSSNEQFPNPRPRLYAMEAKAAMADAPVPMEAGKSSVAVQISGSIQLK